MPAPKTSTAYAFATDLADLWRDQGKRDEAHNLLAQVYRWFTEGFVAELEVTDAARFQKYVQALGPTLAPFNTHILD